MLLIVMQSAHLVAQRKAFQQSMGDALTLSREQTSSQPLIAGALEELKVLVGHLALPDDGDDAQKVHLYSRETLNDNASAPYFQCRFPPKLFVLVFKNRPDFLFFIFFLFL